MDKEPLEKDIDKSEIITKVSQIVKQYKAVCKSKKSLRIGIECEKLGVYRNSGKAARYYGKKGYLQVLKRLRDELGWQVTQLDNGDILELERGKGTRITLESDGRIEFTGSPYSTIHDVAREFRLHRNEIHEMSKLYNIAWLGLGFQPISRISEVELIPKLRSLLAIKYRQSHGMPYSQDWSKQTASIQVNFDYTSEKNMSNKFRTMVRIAPIITAIYANSPFCHGKTSKYLSYRTYISLKTDPERFTLPKLFYETHFSLDDWIEYSLDIPFMFFFRKGMPITPEKKLTFRKFMEHGYEGYFPTIEDYKLHSSYIYTDARLRDYIEFRNSDTVPPDLVPSVAALVKSIVDDQAGCKHVEDLTANWSYKDIINLRQNVARDALQATIKGKKVLDYAKELLEISTLNLKKHHHLNEKKEDESIYLMPIKEYIFVREKSPARYIAEKWQTDWNKNIGKVIEWCEY